MFVFTGKQKVSDMRDVLVQTDHLLIDSIGLMDSIDSVDFADSIDANAVHGSDSPESAKREISYFFG